MTGHRKWREIRRSGGPESEARVAELKASMRASMTLAELRRARSLTQAQVGEALQMPQGAVSRLEHQADMYLSTLGRFVEAMGGKLELRAVFPDGATTISSLEGLGEDERAGPDSASDGDPGLRDALDPRKTG